MSGAATPVASGQRLESLDVIRGFALLGILAMNIQSFAMVGPAYLNPSTWGDLTGINLALMAAARVLADLKFMGLFSLLFGAGLVLFAERAEAAGRRPGPLHYRRMFWLWLVGMLHGYLLWSGDILVTYAVAGSAAYLLRRRSLRTLWILGVIFLLLPTITYALTGLYGVAGMPADSKAGMLMFWNPGPEAMAEEVKAFQGGWLDQMPHRFTHTVNMQLVVFWLITGWRALGLMTLGMALFRSGVLSGRRSRTFYGRLALIGFGVGLPLVAWGLWRDVATGWTLAGSMFLGHLWNFWGSLGVMAGYVGVLMLLVDRGAWSPVRHGLSAVGRMAFSNYLGQTVICTTVFYGHGLGLFGTVERWQQALVVLGVWALQLLVSPWWLARYRFGPMEWVWRSLTYWQRQPFSRDES